jgi:hypothetical protein
LNPLGLFLNPLGLFLRTSIPFTLYMACSERLPTHLNPLAERTGFSQAWDPPPLAGGGVATTWVGLKGLSRGDVLSAGLSSMDPLEHTVQLTAMAGRHVAKVVLHNLDGGSVDIGPGLLRVVVVKIL